MDLSLYPWQHQQWQQLIARRHSKRLPHALLFVGIEGLGKKHCALAYSQVLLCNKSDSACGQCHNCHLFQAQVHPDLLLIEPEKPGQMIKVDQIREMVQFVNETAMQGGLRIVIIDPANAMNLNAANALLKTLEEPAPNTLLILISNQNLRLPATITSRCQKLIFQKPVESVALEWLETQLPANIDRKLLLNLADGAPLRAKAWNENGLYSLRQDLFQGLDDLARQQIDPLQLAAKFQEYEMVVVLQLILIWLQDLLRIQLTQGECELINFDYQSVFTRLARTCSSAQLINFLDVVKDTYTKLMRSLNLNRQLVLEELFIRWMQYATG